MPAPSAEARQETMSMRIGSLFAALLLALGLAAGLAPAARAQVEVDVNQANVQPLPIAIAPFGGSGPTGAEIAKVISANLERSGLFRSVDPSTFPERSLDIAVQPKLDAWKGTGAQALLQGVASVSSDGRLRVDFRLWDVGAEGQLIGMQFTATPDNWRRVAHKISDAVYEKLTGEKGYFDTRVVFVAESGPKTNRTKRLAIMDQDGANPSYITDGSYIVMSPRFSSTSQTITYMALRPTGSSVYVLNIETGRQETVGRFTGQVMAPRFSPDGTKVAFSVVNGSNIDVYSMDLRNRETRRLTTDPAIDTSPSFSPSGGQLVFNSDRAGSPQLYVMNADGSGVRRISSGSGRYTTPVWSPQGDFIAFTKQTGSTFHIGVMRPDGSDERLLTSSYLDEGPTWAPNGRVLMFERESGGAPHLFMVDITGRIERQVPYPSSASDPSWSPLLE
jgi:TolB protein